MKNGFEMKALSFMITDKCNLNCSFCSRNSGLQSHQYMEPEFIKKHLLEALSWSSLSVVNLTGGEPFLHPNISQILEIINSLGLNTRINTNGLFLDSKIHQIIDKYNVNLFTISLDSSIANIHDDIRGLSGAFDKTISNIKILVSQKRKVFIKATVNESNVNTIFDLMRLCEELGVYGFSFGRAMPIGRAKNNKLNNSEFINNYINMGYKVSSYASNSKMQILIDDPLRHFFDKRIIEYIANYDIPEMRGGCSAGCRFLLILPNCDVLACPAISEPCGNLLTENLQNIWYNSKQIKELRSRKNLEGDCKNCINKNICGGCRAYAESCSGNLLSEDTFCKQIRTCLICKEQSV